MAQASMACSAGVLAPCQFVSKGIFSRHSELLWPCALPRRTPFRRTPITAAAKGFGAGSRKKGNKGVPRKGAALDDDDGLGEGWFNIANAADFEGGKQIKSVIMPGNKQAVVVYRVDGKVYASDANSTAYEFPLSDANIITSSEGKTQVEVPLDGTIYDLETGAVQLWCPKNNPVRALLGTLKSNQKSKPLRVYKAVEQDDGSIFVNLG